MSKAKKSGALETLRAAEELVGGKADAQLQIRMTRGRKEAWKAEADRAKVTLSAWVISRVER